MNQLKWWGECTKTLWGVNQEGLTGVPCYYGRVASSEVSATSFLVGALAASSPPGLLLPPVWSARPQQASEAGLAPAGDLPVQRPPRGKSPLKFAAVDPRLKYLLGLKLVLCVGGKRKRHLHVWNTARWTSVQPTIKLIMGCCGLNAYHLIDEVRGWSLKSKTWAFFPSLKWL